jgi:DNA end-binding protein Ku
VIDSLVGDFEPQDQLVSEYREELRALLEAKLSGQEVARPEPVEEAPVVDLMEALKRSVDEAKKRKETPAATRRKAAGAGKRTAARRSA